MNRTAQKYLVATSLGLTLLAGGCARSGVVELAREPAATSLSPAPERLSDLQRRKDLNFLHELDRHVDRLPEASAARAEAALLLEAVRALYVTGSGHAWLDEQVARVQALFATDMAAGTRAAGLQRGYATWIAHVRATQGFRAALPLLVRAEQAGVEVALAPGATDAQPMGLDQSLAATQARLAALHDAHGVPVTCYAWAKAQAWLDYAVDEHALRDYSGIVGEARAQAERIVAALEAPAGAKRSTRLAAVARENPTLGAATRAQENFRADLWRQAAAAHSADGASRWETPDAVLATLARLEVVLRQAAHENGQRGSRASQPYELAAQRLAAQLQLPTP